MAGEQRVSLDLEGLEGYRWLPNGQSAFAGKMLRLFRRLDQMFLGWAREYKAGEYVFPTFISARDINRLDYFKSFPHLVTMPVTLHPDEENLKRFAAGQTVDDEGEVQITGVSPICDVLTPAACYHFYIACQGANLREPYFVTTRAHCFRREDEYEPLVRQWCFSMREIVCMGGAEDVKLFLDRHEEKIALYFEEAGIDVRWKNATDPFFDPSHSPKYLAQKLEPVKTEMTYGQGVAIGSLNFHRNYFGEAFDISYRGNPAYSGCVAFGLERWMYVILAEFGDDEASWPLPKLKDAYHG